MINVDPPIAGRKGNEMMETEKLKLILEKHGQYLKSEPGGERANLSGVDLRGADLSGANLSGADAGENRFVSMSGIGSSRRMTTYWVNADKIWSGCFTGTMAEFEAAIEKTHKDNADHLAHYRAAVAFFKACKGE